MKTNKLKSNMAAGPEYPHNVERMRGDTETPQQTATLPPSHGAACSLLPVIEKVAAITGRAKGEIENALVTIGIRLSKGKSDMGGLMQERIFTLLSRDNPEILEELRSLPVDSYYPRQSKQPNQARL